MYQVCERGVIQFLAKRGYGRRVRPSLQCPDKRETTNQRTGTIRVFKETDRCDDGATSAGSWQHSV